jgi:MarR family transcriptional regulator, transcriptional regulator for hemolysin
MSANDWQPMATPGHYFSRIARGLARVGDARLRPLGFATAQLPVQADVAGGSGTLGQG